MNLDRFRVSLISILTLSTVSVWAKTIIFPSQNGFTQFEIPALIELSNSKIQSVVINENQKTFQSGRRYQQNAIDIEIRHLVNTGGDIEEYLRVYRSMSLTQAPTIRQREDIGFYGLFTEQNRSYLSACINPRGESTFTGTQFARNRNLYDIRVDRIIPWLFTSASLRDQRCLWVQISTPTTFDRDYSTLEKTWFSLYPTLRDRFSKSAES
jgi:cyanosortase A-associated protein